MKEFFMNNEFWLAIISIAILAITALYIQRCVKKQTKCSPAQEVVRARVIDKDKSHYPFMRTIYVDGMTMGDDADYIENCLNMIEGVWAQANPYTGEVKVYTKMPIQNAELEEKIDSIRPYRVATR